MSTTYKFVLPYFTKNLQTPWRSYLGIYFVFTKTIFSNKKVAISKTHHVLVFMTVALNQDLHSLSQTQSWPFSCTSNCTKCTQRSWASLNPSHLAGNEASYTTSHNDNFSNCNNIFNLRDQKFHSHRLQAWIYMLLFCSAYNSRKTYIMIISINIM